ncbi:metalloregulator ArsR/SmtB family transcription factor [Aneurinibacillus sp. Ricciae_BoGa-3]|uniref:ArsR/SmtB family transcription factor n=1 Tax=Aneurinibacillus sp. Ricciae_BoGa-3 TaxID=3022697 RepID=UPI0023426223|nr:metalloregulator ArsR/SmtB family transcription factor [Aneurinibacillus sp. Ricciae_BoGa-3]WCK52557.1 metalloregulator ArsR/SmtB family transcription factor [Aneurinibacillus sp. Ricciae_BoGa-3]
MSNDITQMFKALAHPARVQILDFLNDGPMTTGELSDKFQVSRYAIMKHLAILEQVSLVIVRRRGRERLNYLNAVPLQQLYNRWVSKYESKLSSSLLNLKDKLEAKERGTANMDSKDTKLAFGTFQIEQEVMIEASPQRVFNGLTEEINDWWEFRLGGKETKLILEPKLNGLFYEDCGNEQGIVWGTVIYFKKPVEIRLIGLLGMTGAVNSHYSYKLEEKGSSTLLRLSHDAVGLLEPQWEEEHRKGWAFLLGKLKEYTESKK